MATRRVEIGPTGETVRANVTKFRNMRGLTLRNLSEKLEQGGRKMAHNTISEIERGARRVDVDDLMALAEALDVLPTDLLGVTDAMEVLRTFVTDQLRKITSDPKAMNAMLGVSDGDN